MRKQMEIDEEPRSTTWTNGQVYVLALVCLVSGLLLGYLFRGSSPAATGPSTVAAAGAPANPGMPSAEDLSGSAKAAMEALKKNPKDVDALIELGNLYYDHQLWEQAIDTYSRALELQPNNVNVRSDLGTAYLAVGQAERAVQEYEKALKVDPTHANTLLNLGVAKWRGMNDPKSAIAAWKKLLETNPDYKDRQKVEALIEHAQSGKGFPH